MTFNIAANKTICGQEAAQKGSDLIQKILTKKKDAALILATGASQFEMLSQLIKEDIDWSRITVFHLDEYVGLLPTHNASFRKYLKERFEDQVKGLKAFHYIQADAVPLDDEIKRLNKLIGDTHIDVAFVGVGENGHLAFNDPPADFDTEVPYFVVNLDRECRLQQRNEGWFAALEDVPVQAVSMSVQQILKSTHIINTVPDARKAKAVANCFNNPISNLNPASILREHKSCFHFLDKDSAIDLDIKKNL